MSSPELDKLLHLSKELDIMTMQLRFINREIRSLIDVQVNTGTTKQEVREQLQEAKQNILILPTERRPRIPE